MDPTARRRLDLPRGVSNEHHSVGCHRRRFPDGDRPARVPMHACCAECLRKATPEPLEALTRRHAIGATSAEPCVAATEGNRPPEPSWRRGWIRKDLDVILLGVSVILGERAKARDDA